MSKSTDVFLETLFPKLKQEVKSNFLFERLSIVLWTEPKEVLSRSWFSSSLQLKLCTLTILSLWLFTGRQGLKKKAPLVGWGVGSVDNTFPCKHETPSLDSHYPPKSWTWQLAAVTVALEGQRGAQLEHFGHIRS